MYGVGADADRTVFHLGYTTGAARLGLSIRKPKVYGRCCTKLVYRPHIKRPVMETLGRPF
jgi:hypothetical protein